LAQDQQQLPQVASPATTPITVALAINRAKFIEYLMTECSWPRDKAEMHFVYATDALRTNEEILESVLVAHPALSPEEALVHLWFAGL
jgi:hypothetical protein